MRKLDDKALVALLKATGDRDAFGELFRRHHGTMQGYLLSLGADGARVNDIMQQSFLTALLKIGQFRGEASFRTWLFTIGYREHLQALRRAEIRQRAIKTLVDNQHDESDLNPNMNEEHIDIARAISMLSEEERAALILCDAYGFSHGEAAKITGRPVGTIKSHIRRARIRAKNLLVEGENNAS
ncbi:MAG: sigma-70 family RNA polymerase sigma factor [Pseudomonadota bacterium]